MTFKWVYVPAGRSYMTDPERGITLIDKPNPPELPYELELNVGDKKIIFEVELGDLGRQKNNTVDVYWNVLRGYGDRNLLERKDELIKVVREALEVRGWYGKPERTNSVTVDFNHTVWG